MPDPNPVGLWWDTVGNPLVSALREMRAWSLEGSPEVKKRAISLLELAARVEGQLVFNGRYYDADEGFCELLAKLARSITTPVYASSSATSPSGEELLLGSTSAFDLASLIAMTNSGSGHPVPECLQEFTPPTKHRPVRPRSRGDDIETRALRDILSWWAVEKGVKLGLKAERNRDEAVKYNRLQDLPSACDLVTDAFHKAEWAEYTYNMAVTAWQPHRYSGSADQRKLTKKTNTDAYFALFPRIDELVGSFSGTR